MSTSDKKKLTDDIYNATENYDKVGDFDSGHGIGSKSNIEKLAKDYVNSNYESFTKGNDYASLAKRYSDQGHRAMDDTIGQVAARTGGLASSYAASAGQQAYGGWMEKLEDAARSLYDSQQAERLNKLGVAQGIHDRNYGEYRDTVSNAQWADEQGYKGAEFNRESAENFKDSIYEAAYWGDANWDNFKDNEYGITEAEFNRIVASAQGKRTDDTYERDAAKKAQALSDFSNDVYMDMYLAGDKDLKNMNWKNYSDGMAVPEGFSENDFEMLKRQIMAARAEAVGDGTDYDAFDRDSWKPTLDNDINIEKLDSGDWSPNLLKNYEAVYGKSYFASLLEANEEELSKATEALSSNNENVKQFAASQFDSIITAWSAYDEQGMRDYVDSLPEDHPFAVYMNTVESEEKKEDKE